MMHFVRRHPIGTGLGAVAFVSLGAWLAFGYFGVHTLFVDDVVDEALPTFSAPTAAAAGDTTESETARADADPNSPSEVDPTAGNTAVSEGTSEGASADSFPDDDNTSADAEDIEPEAQAVETVVAETVATEIVTEASGTFESLSRYSTSGEAIVLGNGSDQRFLRLEDFATDNGPDLNVYLVNSSTGDVSDFVDLGDLSGNIGSQNYEIPAGVDLSVYDQVVIWCVRFGVGFGQADLTLT